MSEVTVLVTLIIPTTKYMRRSSLKADVVFVCLFVFFPHNLGTDIIRHGRTCSGHHQCETHVHIMLAGGAEKKGDLASRSIPVTHVLQQSSTSQVFTSFQTKQYHRLETYRGQSTFNQQQINKCRYLLEFKTETSLKCLLTKRHIAADEAIQTGLVLRTLDFYYSD